MTDKKLILKIIFKVVPLFLLIVYILYTNLVKNKNYKTLKWKDYIIITFFVLFLLYNIIEEFV
jgi:hypothetical protein